MSEPAGIFTIVRKSGDKEAVAGIIVGDFGLWKCPPSDRFAPRKWSVTHIPTGFRIPPEHGFPSKRVALRFVRLLLATGIDFNHGTLGARPDHCFDWEVAIRNAAKECGA
jgi:hypothetical protein